MKKSMRSKTIGVMAAGMIVTGSLGAAAYANGNAYEHFRSAAVQTMEIDNSTMNSTIEIRQNGKVTASGQFEVQKSGEESYSLGQFEVGGQKLEVEQATEDGKVILRKGDQYYSAAINPEELEEERFDSSPSAVRLAEAASDLLLGDIKNRFTQNGDTITLSLTGAQIPELANLAMNAVLEAGAHQGQNRLNEEAEWQSEWKDFDSKALFPIVSDSRVESVRLDAGVQNGAISTLTTTIVVSGLDENGQKVELEASMDSIIGELGTTVPQDIDVTGQTVKELEEMAGSHGFGHGGLDSDRFE
ncbi:hypothetical protein [Saccharibacillus kuerlensis]|uniref:Uncharacterized protein n=1 Tax=Saccharibacillus kuerlensis TaxID=459527 RepID=A0ABQ2L9A0_9BACL|nr:hypothetical protein [Saccharibacillus kuerlensis]GGO05375.1 hypothetical protein GCM10010969_31730 [Saccharibacillus kuerlensis]